MHDGRAGEQIPLLTDRTTTIQSIRIQALQQIIMRYENLIEYIDVGESNLLCCMSRSKASD